MSGKLGVDLPCIMLYDSCIRREGVANMVADDVDMSGVVLDRIHDRSEGILYKTKYRVLLNGRGVGEVWSDPTEVSKKVGRLRYAIKHPVKWFYRCNGADVYAYRFAHDTRVRAIEELLKEVEA